MKTYQAAIDASDEAIKEYKFYVEAYRSQQIDDDEFLAARAKYTAAMAKFDKAYDLECGNCGAQSVAGTDAAGTKLCAGCLTE